MDNRLIFLGDVFINDNRYKIDLDCDYIFNLECTITDESCAKPIKNKINLNSVSECLKMKRKPMAVNIANNHILDFTEKGFEDTIIALEKNSISYFGAGNEENNYNNPCFIEKNNKRIALLGYCDIVPLLCNEKNKYSVANIDYKRIIKDISFSKENGADFVIVNVHWGREERPCNTKRQCELGHFFIDNGADLVIGHHPHCIQPIEEYKGKFIFYSLGNYLFNDIASPSYYYDETHYEFIMHKRHLGYGRKSLVPEFSVESDDIKLSKVHLTKLKKFYVKFVKTVSVNSVIPKLYRIGVVNEFVGYARMMTLFLISNSFVNGKLFNVNALKKEFEFIRRRKS